MTTFQKYASSVEGPSLDRDFETETSRLVSTTWWSYCRVVRYRQTIPCAFLFSFSLARSVSSITGQTLSVCVSACISVCVHVCVLTRPWTFPIRQISGTFQFSKPSDTSNNFSRTFPPTSLSTFSADKSPARKFLPTSARTFPFNISSLTYAGH